MSRRKRIAQRISSMVLDYLLALPIGCAVALAWANTFPESYFRFAAATAFAVNNVGMVFFFALITKEVAEAVLPGGALHPWRRAALPMAAAIGGAVVSIAGYLGFVHYAVGEHMLESGWIAACAVDIPGSYIIARVIFGRHPAVPFLLLLAISADAIGLILLAVLQPVVGADLAVGLVLMIAALAIAAALRRAGVRSFWPACLPRWRSCRSCHSFRTADAILVCSSSRRLRRTTRSQSSNAGGACRWKACCCCSGSSTRASPFMGSSPAHGDFQSVRSRARSVSRPAS